MRRIIFLIVVGLVIFVLGGVAGYFYKCQQAELYPNAEKASEIIETLSSKLFPPSTASGRITKISGQDITLSKGAETVDLAVPTTAKVYSFKATTGDAQQTSAGYVLAESSFSDIKIGDDVNVSIEILPNGVINVLTINILPAE
jgi:hypothetical protein